MESSEREKFKFIGLFYLDLVENKGASSKATHNYPHCHSLVIWKPPENQIIFKYVINN